MTTTPHVPQSPPPIAPSQTPKSSGCGKAVAIGCGIILIVGAIACAAIAVIVLGAIKHTDVYRHARDRAMTDPRVIARLGSPVESGWWVSGNVHTEDATGAATIKFPISGSHGKATVSADATLENGSWVYQRLVVHPDSGGDIDVLHP